MQDYKFLRQWICAASPMLTHRQLLTSFMPISSASLGKKDKLVSKSSFKTNQEFYLHKWS